MIELPTIYNFGGGSGGGYKDGGSLVDSDFIKVENNCISQFDNLSRSEINFYFEEDQILNSVVEITTSANANINVYVVKNGLLVPLGIIGSNSITSGNDYKLIVIGNSFVVENITVPSSDPVAAIIDGNLVKVYVDNGIMFTDDIPGGRWFGYLWQFAAASAYVNNLGGGWEIIRDTDVDNILNAYTGDKVDHFNINWRGYISNTEAHEENGTAWFCWRPSGAMATVMYKYDQSHFSATSVGATFGICLRLRKAL